MQAKDGCAVKDKTEGTAKPSLPRDEIDAQKRELRVLLDSFHVRRETLLDETLDDPDIRRKMGKFISQAFTRPGDL
jgi:hypothetical protein